MIKPHKIKKSKWKAAKKITHLHDSKKEWQLQKEQIEQRELGKGRVFLKNVLMKGDKDKHFGENLSLPREELTNEMPQKDTRGTRKIPTKPSVKYKITDKTHTPKNYKISEIDR